MREINVIPNGYKAFTAVDNNVTVGRLEYLKWYSSRATINIGDQSLYSLEPKGFWQTHQELKKDGILVLQMQMKWNGSIIIKKPKDAERFYTLQPKGFFKNGYVLSDYKGNDLMHIRYNFSWKSNSGYIITCGDDFGNDEFEQLLMLLTVHYYKAMQNAATIGTIS